MDKIVSIQNLTIEFNRNIEVVKNINLDVIKGKTTAIVGESGSGKTLSALSILKLLPNGADIKNGNIFFNNVNLLKLNESEIQKIRGNKISTIFQEPMTSLNPLHTINKQIEEIIRAHNVISKNEAKKKTINLLKEVGLGNIASRPKIYPYELSGGQRQRAMIAMSIANNPEVLIADEPTTALDVVIQDQILNEIRKVQDILGLSLIYISHDIAVIAEMTDNMAVMYAGRIVEKGPTKEVFQNPRHSYTQSLLASTPSVVGDKIKLKSLDGEPPSLINEEIGCSFAPRCPNKNTSCNPNHNMELVEVASDHYVDICNAESSK